MELRWMGAGEDGVVVAAEDLFDGPVKAEVLSAFLADARHHLCLAFVDGEAVGFVSGVEVVHPDKGTEMFLYELGVRDDAQRRGIATALVSALRELADAHGCSGMWVLTEADNEAALRTYAAAGADERSAAVMLSWTFDSEQPGGLRSAGHRTH